MSLELRMKDYFYHLKQLSRYYYIKNLKTASGEVTLRIFYITVGPGMSELRSSAGLHIPDWTN